MIAVDRFRSDDEAAGYLAAAIDADGCVYFGRGENAKTGKKWTQRRVIFTVTDPELVDTVADACDRFDIGYHRSDRPNSSGNPAHKHTYTLEITAGHALRRFDEVVILRHPGKREKLQECLDSFQMKGRCSGCGQPWDERTEGCEQCRTRHRYRDTVRPDGLLRRVG